MIKLLKHAKPIDRHHKLVSIFNFVHSYEPFGGKALTQDFSGVDLVWSLLESIMSAGVGSQEATTPLIIDKFVGSSASIIAPEGWKILPTRNQVKL